MKNQRGQGNFPYDNKIKTEKEWKQMAINFFPVFYYSFASAFFGIYKLR